MKPMSGERHLNQLNVLRPFPMSMTTRLLGIVCGCFNAKRLWSIADYGESRGRRRLSRIIYSYLHRRRLTNESDFLYAALSLLRKNRISDCHSLLETGQTAFPSSESLHLLYATVTLTHNLFPRYSIFSQSLHRQPPATLYSLYQLLISSGNLEQFLFGYGDAQHFCSDEELRSLELAFLSTLEQTSLSFSRARLLVFYGRYLDLPQTFLAELYSLVVQLFSDCPAKCQILRMLDALTPPMVLSGQLQKSDVSNTFIERCRALLRDGPELIELDEPLTDLTPNWTPWQGLLCSATLEQYPAALSALDAVVHKTWPKLQHTSERVRCRQAHRKSRRSRVRVGFAVHDSMPMMSGLAEQLDSTRFETVFLRPGRRGSSRSAQNWPKRVNRVVEFSDRDTVAGIEAISRAQCDIIVSGPSMGAILLPMLARLASLQMVLLEPHWLNGTRNVDYYVSWEPAEPANHREFYASPVAFLRNPPYWLEWPACVAKHSASTFDAALIRRRLLGDFAECRAYLCASTPPKIHPEMDSVFVSLLRDDPGAVLIFTRADYPPSRTLQQRLRLQLKESFRRVIFLPTLPPDDAHALVRAVDCCLDSFPITGMSSSFDATFLGTPIVTLSSATPFGRWTSAIYDHLGVHGLTARSTKQYLEIATKLAGDSTYRKQKRQEIEAKAPKLIESKASAQEFEQFLLHAWERHLTGQKPTDWLRGRWTP